MPKPQADDWSNAPSYPRIAATAESDCLESLRIEVGMSIEAARIQKALVHKGKSGGRKASYGRVIPAVRVIAKHPHQLSQSHHGLRVSLQESVFCVS